MKKMEIKFEKNCKKILILCFFAAMSHWANAQFTPFSPNSSSTSSPVALTINGVYVGRGAGNSGTTNISIGSPAAFTNVLADGSLAVGTNALSNTSNRAIQNVAVGWNSMLNNNGDGGNTGCFNVAVGVGAMQATTGATGGSRNVAVGWGSLVSSTTGANNTAIGEGALRSLNNTDLNFSSNNTAIGRQSLSGLTTGSNNVGIGSLVGVIDNAGSNQLSIQNVIYGINMNDANAAFVGIGAFSTTNLPTAKLDLNGALRVRSIPAIAAQTNYLVADLNGNIRQAPLPSNVPTSACSTQYTIPKVSTNGSTALMCSQITDNGTTVGIGSPTNSSYTTPNGGWLFPTTTGTIETYVPAPTTTTAFRLSVQGVTRSLAYFAYSDERLKKNIRPIKNSISVIKKLNGVTYQWDKNNEKAKEFDDVPQVGFIAQEVANVVAEAVVKDGDGYYSMNYSAIIPILNEGIKEQQTQIESQNLEIENLKLQLTELKNKVNQLTPGDVKIKVNSLEVVPNPVTGISVVSYKLDNGAATSFLVISDLQGKIIRQISLAKDQSAGQVQISKRDIGKGMYVFTIVSGNAEVQSKKVLVAE